MARKIADTDRAAVLEAVREVRVNDSRVTVPLESGGEVRVSRMTGTLVAVMPAGSSSYTRTRSGGSRETCGVFFAVTPTGELEDAGKIASHVDVIIRRAIAAVESYAAVAA
jgi:hypothetical protein